MKTEQNVTIEDSSENIHFIGWKLGVYDHSFPQISGDPSLRNPCRGHQRSYIIRERLIVALFFVKKLDH